MFGGLHLAYLQPLDGKRKPPSSRWVQGIVYFFSFATNSLVGLFGFIL